MFGHCDQVFVMDDDFRITVFIACARTCYKTERAAFGKIQSTSKIWNQIFQLVITVKMDLAITGVGNMPPHATEDTHGRKQRVYLLLRSQTNGLRESEIAERLNLERRSVNNYLTALEQEGKLYKEGMTWFVQTFTPAVIRPLEIQAEEATVLYLAARMLVKQSDRRNEIAETVLHKLAHVLKADAGVAAYIEEAALELAQRPLDREYIGVFRSVARSYLYHRKLQIHYQPYQGSPFVTTFSPYLIEPSTIGFSTYVIGYSENVQALRTYKMERIQEAKLLKDEYDIPEDFPGLELLRNAWSIYYGEETVEVILRFHPEVAKRVQESRWHPSQQTVPDTTDPRFLCVYLQVADTTDLTPWIRTWGANVEVLAPPDLRDRMMGEARRLGEMYGWFRDDAVDETRRQFNDLWGD
jgi:predicted DNA-binding transcriptional regulator YafY